MAAGNGSRELTGGVSLMAASVPAVCCYHVTILSAVAISKTFANLRQGWQRSGAGLKDWQSQKPFIRAGLCQG